MKTVKLTSEWALVTDQVAMIQFVEDAIMQIGNLTAPTDNFGFTMDEGEKFISSVAQNVWARSKGRETTYAIVAEV